MSFEPLTLSHLIELRKWINFGFLANKGCHIGRSLSGMPEKGRSSWIQCCSICGAFNVWECSQKSALSKESVRRRRWWWWIRGQERELGKTCGKLTRNIIAPFYLSHVVKGLFNSSTRLLYGIICPFCQTIMLYCFGSRSFGLLPRIHVSPESPTPSRLTLRHNASQLNE